MTDYKLPSKLRRHFVNLSTTIQTFLGECILAIEGLDAEANRNARTEFEVASRSQKATEAISEKLRAYLEENEMTPTDGAIAVATISGRTTREIADFHGYEQRFVMRRLCAIHKAIGAWRPSAGALDVDEVEGAEVIELFAQAQRA